MKTILTSFLLAPAAFAAPALDCHATLGSGRFNTVDVSLVGNLAHGEQPVLFRYLPSNPWLADLNLGGELRYASDLKDLELHLFHFGKDVNVGTARLHDRKIDLLIREGTNLLPAGAITLDCG